MEILAIIGTVAYGVLLVILGLNAVIIVHELGHFLVARWCGVRVEKFYIWFDFWGLKFFKFKWGETEYGLGLFPLGGYVKMLGQEDNPGAIQAEIERAKLAQTGTEGLTPPAHDTDNTVQLNIAIFSPESYLSKSVPQRLAIIVAGVIMNFLFAIVCAAGAYLYGVTEVAPAVGNVMPGSPAWVAGLLPGDKITAIDGTVAREFKDVNLKMIEGNQTIQLTIERQGESVDIDVSPRRRDGELVPSIGVMSLPTLKLDSRQRLGHWMKYYPAETLDVLRQVSELNPMYLEKMDGQAVNSFLEYQEAQLKKIGLPITCTIGGVDVEVPALPMQVIPVRFKMGAIASVLPGSDAEKQGIKEGDTIISVDGDADFDPLKLPQILLQKVNVGKKTVELVIKKIVDAGTSINEYTLELVPSRIFPDLGITSARHPLGSTALGLSWNVEPVIAEVNESKLLSGQPVPAIGDRVVEVVLLNREPILKPTSFSDKTSDGVRFHRIGDRVDMPYIFACNLQILPVRNAEQPLSVRLVLESADKTTKIINLPVFDADDWFQPERGLGLKTEQVEFHAAGIGEALSLGTAKTVQYTLLVYKTLQSLLDGTVSPRALNGPVGIVEILYRFAHAGWAEFLILLCLIGANLAVINLLPIPPLDGGHVVFLVYEGIFRRQPNEIVQVILSYFGLFLILLLMVWTVTLDLQCIPRW